MAIPRLVKNYKHGSNSNLSLWTKAVVIVVVLILVAGATVLAKQLAPERLVPSSIQKRITSTIFLPNSPNVTAKKETVKYDSKTKLLSYQAAAFGITTVISEQPTPDTFTDIPQVYDKVLESWKQYEKFDTASGTVYLTRPGDQGGKEVGVMNSKGTLMFVKPEKDLSDDQWRQFFKSLKAL
jgi:multidrug efflux pump subunit AcrB